MPCPLPHNHYCCSLPSPVCLPHLHICAVHLHLHASSLHPFPLLADHGIIICVMLMFFYSFHFFLFLWYVTFLCDSYVLYLCFLSLCQTSFSVCFSNLLPFFYWLPFWIVQIWVACKRWSSANSGAWLPRFDDLTGVLKTHIFLWEMRSRR